MTAPGENVGVGVTVGVGVGVGVAVTLGIGVGFGVGVDVEVGGTVGGDGSGVGPEGTAVAAGWSPQLASSDVTRASNTRILKFISMPGP